MLAGRFVPGSLFLGVAVPGVAVLGVLGALDSLGSYWLLPGLRLSRLVRELWLGVLRVFCGRVYTGRERERF